MNIFKLSDDSKSKKVKMLTLSGVSLFIALTRALPEKIAIIGLDLKGNEHVAGWFVLAITLYFLLAFIAEILLELVRQFKQSIINYNLSKTVGDILGFTMEEANEGYDDEYDPTMDGKPSGEIRDIDNKNKKIQYKRARMLQLFFNIVTVLFSILVPVVFCAVSVFKLYYFLT